MATATRLATAEDLEMLFGDVRVELVDGIIVEKELPNFEHGLVATNVIWLLNSHVRARGLGRVVVEVGFILRRGPDTVRLPDVAFVRADRIPSPPPSSFASFPPDLAIEILSPGNRPGETQARVRDLFEAGVRLIWLVNPETRSVTVVRSLQHREELTERDLLDGGDIIPGFSCRVAELFD